MISRFDDLAVSPEPYADYRKVFETSRLDVTCVRVWPGQTVPAHTHLDEDQIYHVVSGSGSVVLDGVRTDVSAGSFVMRSSRPGPANTIPPAGKRRPLSTCSASLSPVLRSE